MKKYHNRLLFNVMAFLSLISISTLQAEEKSKLPQKGKEVKNFELKTLEDETVKLHDVTKKGPVVLLVLRGYPGYQCPLCSLQMADFVFQN